MENWQDRDGSGLSWKKLGGNPHVFYACSFFDSRQMDSIPFDEESFEFEGGERAEHHFNLKQHIYIYSTFGFSLFNKV